jgi:hypothetical protein
MPVQVTNNGEPVKVTADRKEYYHNYYLKRRDELNKKAKDNYAQKPKDKKKRGRPNGMTFPEGYKKKEQFPAGALRSPPANDNIFENSQ